MRFALRPAPIALCLLLGCATPAFARLSIEFSLPGTQIGVNLGGYPTLQRIPGYPVYYAPGVNTNYFFYDGLYWVYERDTWYASSWYDGPWGQVDPFDVPPFILRVPVRYYRHAPAYFRDWRADAPPRWEERWGRSWEQRHRGWDRWDRNRSYAAAPLPTYQRQYYGDRYPQYSQQGELHDRNYRYQPSERIGREHFQERRAQLQGVQRQEYQGQRREGRQEYLGPQRDQRQENQAQQQRNEQQRRQQANEAARQQQPQQSQVPEPPKRETEQQRNERLGAGG